MKYVAILIILMATSIIQWHGMMFWTEHAGVSGWGWSIVLEAASLWLWWQPKWHVKAVGMVGTIIVLCGPMYQISGPVIASLKNNQANQLEIASLQKDLALQKEQMKQFMDNSKKRTGWLPVITSTQQTIQQTRQSINALSRSKDAKPLWEVIALVVIEMLALIIITIAQITSVHWLSAKQASDKKATLKEKTRNKQPPSPIIQNEPAKTEGETVKRPTAIANTGKPMLKIINNNNESHHVDEQLVRNYVLKVVDKYKTKREAAEALAIDRRELGCVINAAGRKPKQDTWKLLAMNMNKNDLAGAKHA